MAGAWLSDGTSGSSNTGWDSCGWGIPVVLTEVADPNTGDFDGVTISVDWELEPLPIPPFQPSRWVSRFSF